jgi:hypothetical protein
MMETMTKTETALCHLVRLHYSGDQRSFDQLARNLLASNNSALSDEAKDKLRSDMPPEVVMGNPLR